MDAVDSSLSRLPRPSLTHLNADTSWLLQFTRPRDSRLGRSRCNILIDPWFMGSQIDFAPWISEQYHLTPSSVQSIRELDERLKAEEKEPSSVLEAGYLPERAKQGSCIDAIVISHEFTDHCNKHTLLEADPQTAIYATSAAARLIRSWNFFSNVHEVPVANRDRDTWTDCVVAISPWLSVSRITSSRDMGYLHSGVLFTFQLHEGSRNEGILYTPHGVVAEDASWLARTNPPISLLALIHGLHEVSATFILKINLGAMNGARLGHTLGAKYWVVTHDEIKDGRGVIGKVLGRREWDTEEALKFQEHLIPLKTSITKESSQGQTSWSEPKLCTLNSGETLLLV